MTRTSGRPWIRFGSLLALFVAGACSDAPTDVRPADAIDVAAPWARASPASVGLDGDALFVAGELAGEIDRMRSLVVIRDGRLVFERYYDGWTADTLADVRSVTKSVVSTLAGIAIEEGHLELEQPITHFVRAPRFPVRPEHADITVAHLLSMTGGFSWSESGTAEYSQWITSGDHIGYLLARPLAGAPGDGFTYNSAAVHLLGVVLEAATGTTLPEYADRVLFAPMGIAERVWEDLGDGHVNGGAGIDLRPRDLARFGQLFLQRGWSGDRRLLPASWVSQATTPRFTGFPGVGPIRELSYGFLWWLDLERDAFFAWGYGGQFVYVSPVHDMVVVATTDWRGVSRDIGSARLQEEVLGIVVGRIVDGAR